MVTCVGLHRAVNSLVGRFPVRDSILSNAGDFIHFLGTLLPAQGLQGLNHVDFRSAFFEQTVFVISPLGNGMFVTSQRLFP